MMGKPVVVGTRGKQFLVVLPASPTEASQRPMLQINLVLNWLEELKQRVPLK